MVDSCNVYCQQNYVALTPCLHHCNNAEQSKPPCPLFPTAPIKEIYSQRSLPLCALRVMPLKPRHLAPLAAEDFFAR